MNLTLIIGSILLLIIIVLLLRGLITLAFIVFALLVAYQTGLLAEMYNLIQIILSNLLSNSEIIFIGPGLLKYFI